MQDGGRPGHRPAAIIERVPPVSIVSPCTGVCAIDDHDRCRGCARTLDEIAAWSGMTPAERDAVMRVLPDRQSTQR